MNQSKTLIKKQISSEYKCKFDQRKCNSDQWWNSNKCWWECKKRHLCEKDYVWNPATCKCENWKYLASIMDDSAIICDEFTDADTDEEANSYDKIKFDEKKQPVIRKIFIFHLHFC